MKVMIVDDSLFMRSILKKIVTDVGYEVVAEAENGKIAVEKYDQMHPDVTLMDIMMPEMNGIEALKAIIGKDPKAKVIMCTSVGQDQMIDEAVDAGVTDFILKPFKNEQILQALKKMTA